MQIKEPSLAGQWVITCGTDSQSLNADTPKHLIGAYINFGDDRTSYLIAKRAYELHPHDTDITKLHNSLYKIQMEKMDERLNNETSYSELLLNQNWNKLGKHVKYEKLCRGDVYGSDSNSFRVSLYSSQQQNNFTKVY